MNHPNCHLRCPDYFLFTNALFGGPKCVDKSCGRCQLVTLLLRPQNITKRSSKLARSQLNFAGRTLASFIFKSNIISPAGRESKQQTWKKPQRKSFNFQNFLKEFEVYVLLSPCVKALFVLYIIGWLRWPPALFYLLIRCDMYVICLIKHTQHSTHHSWSESVYVN